jgi:two-component system cell cycle response regulator
LAQKSKLHTELAGSLISPNNNEVMGVANISMLEGSEKINQEDNRVLSILLNLTSLAMNNAELFQRTMMMANMDGLTKLYNHRYFQEFFRDELSRHARYKRSISIIISDIDHFKRFNDEYGHQAGDFVLAEVAKIFRSNIRKKIDLAARYGGEEFVIVLPETNASGALKLADRVRRVIAEHNFVFKDDTIKVTISCGVANYPIHEEDPDRLIKAADAALYEAKNTGRNKVCLAE